MTNEVPPVSAQGTDLREWERLSAWHRDGCEKRWPHMIMAPRQNWPEGSVPIWRPRVDGDRPHICTCGLDAALAAPPPHAEKDPTTCRECGCQTGGGDYCYQHKPYMVYPKADGSFLSDQGGRKRISFDAPPPPPHADVIAEMRQELFRVGNHPALGIDKEIVESWLDRLAAPPPLVEQERKTE
jgi:hypothetical protein